MKRNHVIVAGAAALALIVVLLLAWSVRRNQDPGFQSTRIVSEAVIQQQHQEEFDQALHYLNNLDQFEPGQTHRLILSYLDKWITQRKPDPDWILDPMISRLPESCRNTILYQAIVPLKFVPGMYSGNLRGGDPEFLQEAIWMRNLSGWVSRGRLLDAPMADWLDTPEENSLSETAGDELRTAVLLFDWTVRNLQNASVDPSWGIPPGRRLEAWEALQLGLGDTLEKSRVFTLLARQQWIDMAILAIGPATMPSGEPKHRLLAALIDGELYLFDMEWGVPVPGPGGRGVATLAQVLDDPSLLRQMDLPDRPYPLQAEDLETIVAYIDASPQSVSQRMRVLENHLTGDNKTILTFVPSALARRLGACRGIDAVRVSPIPFETRQAWRQWLSDDDRKAAYQQLREPFDQLTPLGRGRILHFAGRFEKEGLELGAKGFYMQCRPSNRIIEQGLEETWRRGESEGLSPAQLDQRRDRYREMLLRMKEDASYWLALLSMDCQLDEAAVNGLEKRTLAEFPGGRWSAGARYNLARMNEWLGLTQDDPARLRRAIELYRDPADENTPQRAGNLWRARWLEERLAEMEQAPATESAEGTEPETAEPETAEPPAEEMTPAPENPETSETPPAAAEEAAPAQSTPAEPVPVEPPPLQPATGPAESS